MFTIGRSTFAEMVSTAGRFASKRSMLPILQHVLLDAHDGELSVSATNLEQAVTVRAHCFTTDADRVTLPAALLGDWLNGVDGLSVEAELKPGFKVELRCGRHTATMAGQDANEYVILPGPAEADTRITINADAFCRMLERVTFAASVDESRPALCAVLVRLEGERVLMAATDGYRLSVVNENATDYDGDMSVLLPAATAAALAKLAKGAETVDMALRQNQAIFDIPGGDTFSGVRLVSQLVDARFPDYNAIIPKSHNTTVTADAAALLRVLRVANLFARDTANTVKLTVAPNFVNVSGSSQESGNGVADIDADVTGEGVVIGFNARYLIDALGVVGDKAILEFTGPMRPLLLRPESGNGAFKHIIMPMELRKEAKQ